ncbi:MAG: N-acetyltransferase [Muribaculaceae bacterium]|nr:N-acetyltransferase [Muribaculaceae bacterium]
MAVEIKQIPLTKKELTKFVDFAIDLYKDNDCYVPPLVSDDVNTLRPEGNPAFDFCECACWMAYRDGKPVGRIAGIINSAVNERSDRKDARFGFVDFIDDEEVVDALFETVSQWGRDKGMKNLVGPLGFTDMDYEGMLIEGFDRLGTMATIYNYPYYPKHMERLGFQKEADWVEFLVKVPDEIPEKMRRVAEIVRKRFGLHTVKLTSRKLLAERYGHALFEVINEAYDKLYGYSPLTPRQIDHYIDMYLGLIRLDGVCVIVDKDDKLVGVGISVPSLSRALQKSRGRLLPFGWYPLLKALKFGKTEYVDLMLVAIKPEYQGKGVNALLFENMIPAFQKCGFIAAETNPELETNTNVQSQWEYFDYEQHKRRRSFIKPLY